MGILFLSFLRAGGQMQTSSLAAMFLTPTHNTSTHCQFPKIPKGNEDNSESCAQFLDSMDSAQGQEEGLADPPAKNHGDAKVPDVSYKRDASRRFHQTDWEDLKSTIISLYWEEDRTLLEVMETMKALYGFNAS